MRSYDALWRVEQAVLTEELSSVTRHDVRNRLASMRNASFYIRRRLSKSEIWGADPRLGEFLQLIDDEVQLAQQSLEQDAMTASLFERRARPCELGEEIARAVQLARLSGTLRVALDQTQVPGRVEADPDELALCLRLLVEDAAAHAPPDGVVRFALASHDARCTIDIGAEHQPVTEVDALGWSLAQRIANRYGWRLERQPHDQGDWRRLSMPLLAESQEVP